MRISTRQKNVLVCVTQQAIIRDQERHLVLMEPHLNFKILFKPVNHIYRWLWQGG